VVLQVRPAQDVQAIVSSDRLIFVYNADDGFFNALNDMAHKVFSPETYQCSLCRFTYGIRGMLLPWKQFVESLPHRKAFLHRNEFRQEFPDLDCQLPVILLEKDGRCETLIAADEIKRAGNLDGLVTVMRERLAKQQAG